jgi:hypothetical protein
MAKYFNTKDGRETDVFSPIDWKSGTPQRAGWIDTESAPVKSKPKEIVDFVFKKPTERTEKPPANVDKVIAETVKENILKAPPVIEVIKTNPVTSAKTKQVIALAGGNKKVLTVKKAKNDNPGKRRTPGKRNT